MTEVKFIHAQFNTEATIYAEKVYGYVTMPANKWTAIVADGGASIPVNETIDEAKAKVAAALAAKQPNNPGKDD